MHWIRSDISGPIGSQASHFDLTAVAVAGNVAVDDDAAVADAAVAGVAVADVAVAAYARRCAVARAADVGPEWLERAVEIGGAGAVLVLVPPGTFF
jgi:hypothetical protein